MNETQKLRNELRKALERADETRRVERYGYRGARRGNGGGFRAGPEAASAEMLLISAFEPL